MSKIISSFLNHFPKWFGNLSCLLISATKLYKTCHALDFNRWKKSYTNGLREYLAKLSRNELKYLIQ